MILLSSRRIESKTCIVLISSSDRFFLSKIDFFNTLSACLLNDISFGLTSLCTRLFFMVFSIIVFRSDGSTSRFFKTFIAEPPPSLKIPRNRCSTLIEVCPNLITSSRTNVKTSFILFENPVFIYYLNLYLQDTSKNLVFNLQILCNFLTDNVHNLTTKYL